MPKFLHFSTHDFGGAAIATIDFHTNLKANGHDSKIMVLHKTSNHKDILSIRPSYLDRGKNKFKKFNAKISGKHAFLNNNEVNNILSLKSVLKALPYVPDAIVLHWVSGFINATLISQLSHKLKVPIFWYFMDFSPLTGGCHALWECDKYQGNCHPCPALINYKNPLLAQKQLLFKVKYLRHLPITLLLGTTGLIKMAKLSPIFSHHRMIHLPLGVDSNKLRPLEQKRCNKDIPKDKIKLCFAAKDIFEERKGLQLLLDCFDELPPEIATKIHLILVGDNSHKFKSNSLSFSIRSFQTDLVALNEVLNSADFLICPSKDDAGPMIINMAIMSGLAIVAFNDGVAPDIVFPGLNGYLAQPDSKRDLVEILKKITRLKYNQILKMKKRSRQIGLDKLSLDNQLTTFIASYNHIKDDYKKNP